MSLFIKVQHSAIFISAIKHAAVSRERGSKCEKRLENDGGEGRSWAGIPAPARTLSAANATILTQRMKTAAPSLFGFNKPFSHRPTLVHRSLTYMEGFFVIFFAAVAAADVNLM